MNSELSTSSNDPPGSGSPADVSVPPLPAIEGASAVLDDAPPGTRTWRAGSLVYNFRGLVTLYLCLLGGDFFWQLRDRAISPSIPLLLRHFGASDFLTAILSGAVAPALAIFLAPIISYRSDRFRSRFGRRIPFLLVSTPPAFIAMMGLALSPWIGEWVHRTLGHSSPGLTTCVLGSFAASWFLFDIAVLITGVVHGALVNDVVPHDVIGTFFGMFRFASLGAGMLFQFFLFGQMQRHYVVIFLCIGLLYLICFMVMCFLVKEGEYPPPPPPAGGGPLERLFGAIRIYLRECLTLHYYLWFFFSFLLANMAFQPINLFSYFFAQSVGMSDGMYGKFSTLQFACSLAQAPLVGWLADKFHPLRLTMLALLLYSITTGLAFLFVRGEWTFAAAHVICGTCSGFWLTATAPLASMLLPKMKFATFASVLVLASSFAQLITSPIIGAIVEHLNHGKPPLLRDYHVIYLWACIFITLSLLATLVVYRYFKGYGGTKNYVAPEATITSF